MVCIYCGNETRVVNSRHQKRANQVWRRRQCMVCESVISTIEQPDLTRALSVRHKTVLQPFSREKLLLSIYGSLRHRQTAVADASALCDTIITRMRPLITDGALDRDALVAIAAEVLSRFDKAAATSYEAFHPFV